MGMGISGSFLKICTFASYPQRGQIQWVRGGAPTYITLGAAAAGLLGNTKFNVVGEASFLPICSVWVKPRPPFCG